MNMAFRPHRCSRCLLPVKLAHRVGCEFDDCPLELSYRSRMMKRVRIVVKVLMIGVAAFCIGLLISAWRNDESWGTIALYAVLAAYSLIPQKYDPMIRLHGWLVKRYGH